MHIFHNTLIDNCIQRCTICIQVSLVLMLLYQFKLSAQSMNPNSILSESANSHYTDQFMSASQQQNDPQFQSFMQNCLTDPSFFETMKQFYVKVNQTKNDTGNLNRNATPYQANPYKPSTISQQSSRQEQYNNAFDQEEELESTSQKQFKREERKLPANPLLKYQPQEKGSAQSSNANSRKIVQQSTVEQQPIKSKYIENVITPTTNSNRASFDLNAIKQNQSINIDIMELPNKPSKPAPKAPASRNFDDEPIRGMKAEDIERQFKLTDDRPTKGMNKTNFGQEEAFPKSTKISNNSTKLVSKVVDDDRPLTGANKDFKQLIKQKYPDAFGQDIQDNDEQQQKKTQPRNFLKRGSRQHLSSAMNKSKQPKKKEEDLNKSGLDRSRDLTPKNQNRSVSQNRILGKKSNKDINDKSINKGTSKNEEAFPNQQHQNFKSKPPLAKTGKVQIKKPQTNASSKQGSNPKTESAFASKKKKGKNVFDDNSQSSSLSEDEPFFKAVNNKQPEANINDDRIEVIDNVYLTNEQLSQILQKYGKPIKHAPKETQSQKIQAIRNKYTQLCQLVESEREAHQAELEKEKEQFQKYKVDQLSKIKNERRVMERQLKSGSSNQNLQKEKEELENLKQQLEKQREDFKKKDKNNRIMLEKYKKENQELKNKIEKLQMERESNVGSKRSLNVYKTEEGQIEEKSTVRQSGKVVKKVEEEPSIKQQVSYKDIKKGKQAKQAKQIKQPAAGKVKYEYNQEQPVGKGKITNVQKEVKIQNKWVSHKFNSDSQSDPSDQQETQQQQSGKMQWSPTMKLSDLTKIDLSIKMVSDQMISSLFKYDNNIEYRRYQQIVRAPGRTVVNSTRNSKNSYVANLYSDRSKEHIYDNGTRKETLQNGYTIIYFKNGDIKQTLPDQTILYYFKEKAVDQITLPNGVNIYRFENNQVEFHFPNNYVEIRHPDGTIKVLGQHTRR